MAFIVRTYMLSNRVAESDCGSPGPVLYLYNNNFPSQMYCDYLPQKATDQGTWIKMLADDIYTIYRDKTKPVSLSFYIHGFDTSATDARIGHVWYGSRLYANGLPQGLVVGVSWPSNCDLPSSGRTNAEASYALFSAVLETIPLVKAALTNKYGANAPALNTSIVCHSMGNYLMSTTLGDGNVPNYQGAVDWVLMLAPDVDYSIFTQNSSVKAQGEAISQMANGLVVVFWSLNDEVLEADEYAGDWYVLGYRGPQQPISNKITNVDFANCNNAATYDKGLPYVPANYGSTTIVHSSYRFVPFLVVLEATILGLEATQLTSGTVKETLKEFLGPDLDVSAQLLSGPDDQKMLEAYLTPVIRGRSRVRAR
ncbi:MAG TPA: alpha/beta hydrolase [Chloroflexia bacterium]|nr:alpha/beta hydrolase [Chloroflexia bacterium]